MINFRILALFLLLFSTKAYMQIELENHEFIRSKTKDGLTTRVLGLNNQDWLYIGSVEQPISNIHFYNKTVGNVMSLRENGNVGIGTENPNATLQIGDSDHFGKPDTEVEIKRLSLAPVSHSGSDWFFTVRDNNYANLDIGYFDRKSLTIRHDGNIGIGTTTPDSRLTVKGKIHAQELKLDLYGAVAPDYVFKQDYKLKTLEEVEAYIQKEGHLPNIPSAKEMKDDGINLKEMNLKMLEKIEEIILYTIQQKKRIDELEQKNQRLAEVVEEFLRERE